jgi:hypothetical protein
MYRTSVFSLLDLGTLSLPWLIEAAEPAEKP